MNEIISKTDNAWLDQKSLYGKLLYYNNEPLTQCKRSSHNSHQVGNKQIKVFKAPDFSHALDIWSIKYGDTIQ